MMLLIILVPWPLLFLIPMLHVNFTGAPSINLSFACSTKPLSHNYNRSPTIWRYYLVNIWFYKLKIICSVWMLDNNLPDTSLHYSTSQQTAISYQACSMSRRVHKISNQVSINLQPRQLMLWIDTKLLDG